MLSNDAKILIVDSSKRARFALIMDLRRLGYYHLKEASDGREALASLMRETFDLVFLDIALPEYDGLDLIRNIRNTPSLADTPLIVLSAESNRSVITQAIDLRVHAYIIKPATVAIIQKRLSGLGPKITPE